MSHRTNRNSDKLKISGNPNGYGKFMHWFHTFSQDPSIAQSIHEVVITSDIEYSSFGPEMPWIFSNSQLHEILYQLATSGQIKRLTISAMYDWNHLPRRLMEALSAILFGAHTKLHFLSLSYVIAPRDVFVNLTKGVKEFHLSNVEIVSSNAHSSRGAYKLTDLVVENMDSDSIGELIKATTPYIAPAPGGAAPRHFPCLVDLSIGPTDIEQLGALSYLVQATVMTLQVLRWDYPNSDYPELPLSTSPISLAEHRQLKKIVYAVADINDAHVYHPDPFEGLTRLLGTIPSNQNRFSELELKMTVPHFSKIQDSLSEYNGWQQIESALVRFRQFDGFTVNLLVMDPRTRNEMREGRDPLKVSLLYKKAILENLILERIPTLASRCSLTLSVPGIMGSISV